MKTIITIIMAVVLSAAQVWAGGVGDAVDVRIVTDDGRSLPTYPVKLRSAIKKVYAEAVKGEQYRIEVKNRLNRRVGIVIAVDGRNIISGEKSFLKSNERMYLLEPHESGSFAGWRRSDDRINRFYFTDVPDSYSAAFGDESAMGLITVAAYQEVQRWEPPVKPYSQNAPSYPREMARKKAESPGRSSGSTFGAAAPPVPAPSADRSVAKSLESEKGGESAGTGYGREEYSPVRTVAFESEKRAVETVFIKYEWRATLCKIGVVRCDLPTRRPPNRLWDNGGYAPPPPGRS